MSKKQVTKKGNALPANIPHTIVAIVLDRSGSMATCATQCLLGLNQEIQTIKDNANAKTAVFLTQFDHEINVLLSNRPAADLKTVDKYEPRGSTRLYDAVGETITDIERKVQDSDNTRYLVTIMSDGEENSSKDWDSKRLAEKIQQLQATGRWTFAYIGANVDLSKIQADLGIPIANMAAYASTPKGTAHAFGQRMAATASYMRCASMSVGNFYDKEKAPGRPRPDFASVGTPVSTARPVTKPAPPAPRPGSGGVPVNVGAHGVQHGEKWGPSRSKSGEFLKVRP